ncbi:TPA: hypothetical protein ACF5HI_004580 [Salmonella enterica]
MFSINYLASIDSFEWKSTLRAGHIGSTILKIIKKQKLITGTPEFDIEYPGNNLPGIFIVKGIPHGSEKEITLVKELLKYLPPYILPRLWENEEFINFDRKLMRQELDAVRGSKHKTGRVRGIDIRVIAERWCDSREEIFDGPNGHGSKIVQIPPGIYMIWGHTAYITSDYRPLEPKFSLTPPPEYEIYYGDYLSDTVTETTENLYFYTLIDEDFYESFFTEIDKLRGRFKINYVGVLN